MSNKTSKYFQVLLYDIVRTNYIPLVIILKPYCVLKTKIAKSD